MTIYYNRVNFEVLDEGIQTDLGMSLLISLNVNLNLNNQMTVNNS